MAEPRVWIGCLACYNGGRLEGAWLDAEDGPGFVPEGHDQGCLRCGADWLEGSWSVLKCPAPDRAGDHYLGIRGPDGSAHEEQWVMDHEGFGGFLSGECSPAEAARVAELMAAIEADGFELEPVSAWADNIGEKLETWDGDARERFEDAFAGEADSGADYAAELADELGAFTVEPREWSAGSPIDVSDRWPFTCIDWQRAWHELELGDGYWTAPAPSGGVYVFRE